MLSTNLLIASPRAELYAAAIQADVPPQCRIRLARTSDELIELQPDPEIILGNPELIAKVLPELRNLKWVQSTWAGVRPLINTGRCDYLLTAARGVFAQSMSEYVAGHLLAHELKLAERTAAQAKRNWLTQPSGTLQGKTMLILGTGDIGSAIASRLGRPFGLRMVGMNSNARSCAGFDAMISASGLNDALAQCDYLINTLPATPASDGMLNASALARLRATAVLVNVGRANALDMDALCNALEQHQLAAAVIDVFPEEPVTSDSRFWTTANLTMTAHVAALTEPHALASQFLKNLGRFLAGQELLGLVDFQRGY